MNPTRAKICASEESPSAKNEPSPKRHYDSIITRQNDPVTKPDEA
jgi:hypothetical protein